jgi:hypothetical protein
MLIEGDASYTALLRRLANGPMKRTPDDIDTNWELFEYVKGRAQRQLNKLLGRPATPETAILAAMVSALQHATEKWLGGKAVTAAVISSPDRIRLTDEELDDVFDYLRIQNLMAKPDSFEDLYATAAAYAGYGRGLCASYTDAYECEREVWNFPTQLLLHIEFNRESLSGTIKMLKGVMGGIVKVAFIDPDLGYAREEVRLATAPESDESLYWAAVSSRIRELVVSFRPAITELLLTGTSASDHRFKAALRDALHDVVVQEVMAVLDGDDNGYGAMSSEQEVSMFEFATARGAAEIAKRRQEGPVRCAQSDECKQRRERGRQAVLQKQGVEGMEL